MEQFLGQSGTFWTGVEAIAVCAYTALITLTLWFLYRQVRTAAKTFQLDAIRRLQELVDDFRDDRRQLFASIPLELALTNDQFARRPPGRRSARRMSQGELRRLALTDEQAGLLRGLSSDQRELAQRVIARLNDIGQLVEDGLIDRRIFLGKYHVMVLQCCHLLEAIRRDEEQSRSGNYGQRLLRMQRWAARYNDISPKHREVAVLIRSGQTHRKVYESPEATPWRKVAWAIQRWFRWY